MCVFFFSEYVYLFQLRYVADLLLLRLGARNQFPDAAAYAIV